MHLFCSVLFSLFVCDHMFEDVYRSVHVNVIIHVYGPIDALDCVLKNYTLSVFAVTLSLS